MTESADNSATKVARTSRTFNLISAVLAFFLWGGWAWYANEEAAARSGVSPLVFSLTQGVCSFTITLLMVRSTTWLYHRFSGTSLAILLPAVITVSVTGCFLTTVHWLVGTPNIARTVTPALVVAFCFNVFTTLKIHRASRQQSSEPPE